MKKSYRILSLLTALVMLIGIFQTAAFATDGTELTVQSAADWSALSSKMSATNGKYVIKLMADLENVSGLTVNGNKTVTLIGNGHTVKLSNGEGSISVSENAVLHLGDAANPSNTLTITRPTANDTAGVLSLSGNATVHMYDGVTIRDSQNSHYYGGGVTIGGQTSDSTTATFYMHGGAIRNCSVVNGSMSYGGGVSVANGGTFIMDAGIIEDCSATTTYDPYDLNIGTSFNTDSLVHTAGGGVFVGGGATFVMNGGTIKNCDTTFMGGGVAVLEARNRDKGYFDSNFTMNGGTIEGCHAGYFGGGVSVSGLRTDYSSICAPQPNAATVTTPGFFTTGGTIKNCTADEWGGGVFVYYNRTGAIDLKNLTVTNNTADVGAGIHLHNLHDSATLTNCTITNNRALGIKSSDSYLMARSDRFAVQNGMGGGLMLSEINSDVSLVGGKITGNTSTNVGAGVYYRFYNSNCNLSVAGDLMIQNNLYNGKLNNLNIDTKYDNSVYPVKIGGLLIGAKIGLSDPKLWNDGLYDDDIAAISENFLTSDYDATNPAKPNNNPRKYFTSDHTTWVPDYGAQTEAIYEDQLQTTTTKVTYYGSQTLSFAKGNNGTAYSVYYDTATNTLTSTTTNEKVSPAWDANNGHVVLYYYSSTARANYWLCDLPAYTSSGTTVIPFENIPTSINIDSSGVAGATGFRFTNLSTNSAKTVNKTVTTNTPVEIVPASDYSSEVRLVRGWQVTYDPNGGEGDRYMESYLPNETVTVNANNYTKRGETFIGWNTAPDGSGVWYQPGSTFEITADLLLYAQWVSGFVLTKDFVIAEGYDGEGTNIPNIKDKVTADPTFTITPYASFNRLVGKDANDIPAFAQESYTIPVSTGTNSLLIEHPEFTMDYGIGDYWYAITENEFSVAGLGKDQTRYLHIQVTWADETRESVIVESISLHATAPDANGNYQNVEDDKTTGFTNTYGAGDLRITKDVKGNLADPNVFFAVTVQFTAPAGKTVMGDITYVGGYQAANAESAYTAEAPGVIAKNWTGTKEVTVYLKDDASVTFTNIPDGVTYTVTESDYTADGYKASYAISDQEADDSANENNATGSISDSLDEVTITNRKDATIDVGLILESLPFVLLAAGIVCFGVVMTVKRRKRTEEELSF